LESSSPPSAPATATVDLSASPSRSPSGPFHHPRTQQGKLYKGFYSTEHVLDPVSPVSTPSLSRRPSVSSTDSTEPASKKTKVTSSSTRERLQDRFPDGKSPEFQRRLPSFSATRLMAYFTLSVADLPPAHGLQVGITPSSWISLVFQETRLIRVCSIKTVQLSPLLGSTCTTWSTSNSWTRTRSLLISSIPVEPLPIKISLSLRINNYVFFFYSVFNLPNTSHVRPN
jgi:hypothetical protein